MKSIKLPSPCDHQSLHFYSDETAGLEVIIAIHTTYQGVSLGGCRIAPTSSQSDAVKEALRLSTHMTYKSLLCDLNMGGGKSVILKKKGFQKNPKLLKALAEAVNSLGGQYIASVDMGMTEDDMQYLRQFTDYVIGYDEKAGGAGDPGPFTARGVLAGMKTALSEKWNTHSLKNQKILVVGLGGVGYPLAKLLLEEGVNVYVSDVDAQKIQQMKNHSSRVKVVDPSDCCYTKCDILSPCASGDFVTLENIKHLQCKIIAGAANNQLQSNEVGQELFRKNILYVPDFAINSGGLIGVVMHGVRKRSKEETYKKIDDITALIRDIIQQSHQLNLSTNEVALEMAKKKYKAVYSKTKATADRH